MAQLSDKLHAVGDFSGVVRNSIPSPLIFSSITIFTHIMALTKLFFIIYSDVNN